MRTAFKIVLMILSLIPLYFAVTGVCGGADQFGDPVSAPLDNQFRYWAGFYMLLFFLIWYVLGNLEERGAVLRLVVLALFLGGLSRLYSYTQVGAPLPEQMGGMLLELGSPILALWHRIIVNNPKYGDIS